MICPLVGKCSEKVKFEQYLNICTNMTEDAYKTCPVYKKYAERLETPSVWRTILTP
jgi:hypothetical protein